MRKIIVATLVLMTVAGCQQVATFAASDAKNASAMAKSNSSDPQAATRAQCYDAWGNLAGGLAALPANTSGIFTGVEAGIEVQGTLQLPACQAIAGQVLLWTVRKLPGGNLLP